MLEDHIAFHLDPHEGVSDQDGKALLRNSVSISKQLLSLLKTQIRKKVNPDDFSADELETMITDHETYWNNRLGRGDVEAEKADVLPGKIIWITDQLIETMKH